MLLAVGQVQQVERRLLSYLEHAFARLVPCITPHLVSEATLRHARLASRRRRLGRIADALRSHAVRCRARPEHLRGRHVRGMPRIGCQRYAAGAGPHQLEYSQFDAALSAHPICESHGGGRDVEGTRHRAAGWAIACTGHAAALARPKVHWSRTWSLDGLSEYSWRRSSKSQKLIPWPQSDAPVHVARDAYSIPASLGGWFLSIQSVLEKACEDHEFQSK